MRSFWSSFIIVLVFSLTSVHAQNTSKTIIKLIQQNKCESAIETMKKEILKRNDNVWKFPDICFSEGAKLLKSGNNKNADLLCKYGLDIIKFNPQVFPSSFNDYLLSLNSKDSVDSLLIYLIKENPIQYEAITNIIFDLMPKLSSNKIKYYPGYFQNYEDGYSRQAWLYPSNTSQKLNEELFGHPNFDPVNSYYFTHVDYSKINSMNVDNLYLSIQKDELVTAYGWYGLHFSTVPELSEYFAELKNMSKFDIASKQGDIIEKIIVTKSQYMLTNLKYLFTYFEVIGKCFTYLNEYNYDKEQASIHLFLKVLNDDNESSVYVATALIPLSLNEARTLYTSEIVQGNVIFRLSPGYKRKGLGITGGGVAAQNMPDLVSVAEPEIIIDIDSNTVMRFSVKGLVGQLWPTYVNTHRWDLNNVWQQDYGKKPAPQNIRIISGTKLN